MSGYNYFRLPNNIFTYSLSTTELCVATALYSIKSNRVCKSNHIVIATQESICRITGIKTKATVAKAVNDLINKGVIKWAKRNKKSNGYLGAYIYALPKVNNSYSIVKRSIFKQGLTPSELRVFLFINKCISSKLNICWNSYNDISKQLGMARSRVIELINKLVSKGVIYRRNNKKNDGSFADNKYAIANFESEQQKYSEKEESNGCAKSIAFQKQTYIIILLLSNINAYSYICQVLCYANSCSIRGSTASSISVYTTQLIPTEEEIIGYHIIELHINYELLYILLKVI